jgi:hypothetical protein
LGALRQFPARGENEHAASIFSRSLAGIQSLLRVPGMGRDHHQHLLAARPEGQAIIPMNGDRHGGGGAEVGGQQVPAQGGGPHPCDQQVTDACPRGQGQSHPQRVGGVELVGQGLDLREHVLRVKRPHGCELVEVHSDFWMNSAKSFLSASSEGMWMYIMWPAS